MTWPKVTIFAVLIGIYTGVILMVPFLDETSFQDIGVTFEWWVFFAIIIVVNCTRSWEAALKCFVFFLISQPVVFLVQVPEIGFEMAWHYLFNYWFKAILLTLPGGFVAYFAKKQNPLGAVILGIGNSIIGLSGISFALSFAISFPHHLLSMIFCALAIIISTLGIQKHTRQRIISFAVTVVISASYFLLPFVTDIFHTVLM